MNCFYFLGVLIAVPACCSLLCFTALGWHIKKSGIMVDNYDINTIIKFIKKDGRARSLLFSGVLFFVASVVIMPISVFFYLLLSFK